MSRKVPSPTRRDGSLLQGLGLLPESSEEGLADKGHAKRMSTRHKKSQAEAKSKAAYKGGDGNGTHRPTKGGSKRITAMIPEHLLLRLIDHIEDKKYRGADTSQGKELSAYIMDTPATAQAVEDLLNDYGDDLLIGNVAHRTPISCDVEYAALERIYSWRRALRGRGKRVKMWQIVSAALTKGLNAGERLQASGASPPPAD